MQFSHSNFCTQPDRVDTTAGIGAFEHQNYHNYLNFLFRGCFLVQIAQNCETRLSRPYSGHGDHFCFGKVMTENPQQKKGSSI